MAVQPQDKTVAELATSEPTISQKFVAKVERQFKAELGESLNWTPLQRALAQHLFLKCDKEFAVLESKRASNSYKKDDPPITWANVNQVKLALDAVHAVNLGLDANIANHVHIVPYLNKRTKQYDVDVMQGYAGKDHVARTLALDPPADIRYQMVHEGDEFDIVTNAYGGQQPVYKPADYFKPGPPVGFFGHLVYKDPSKDRVVVVPYREFEKAMKASKGVEFWGGVQRVWDDKAKKYVEGEYDEKFRYEMMYKTGVIRVTKTIALDPAKINAPSLAYFDQIEMARAETVIDAEAEELANGQVLTIEAKAEDVTAAEAQETPVTAETEGKELF